MPVLTVHSLISYANLGSYILAISWEIHADPDNESRGEPLEVKVFRVPLTVPSIPLTGPSISLMGHPLQLLVYPFPVRASFIVYFSGDGLGL